MSIFGGDMVFSMFVEKEMIPFSADICRSIVAIHSLFVENQAQLV